MPLAMSGLLCCEPEMMMTMTLLYTYRNLICVANESGCVLLWRRLLEF